MNQYFMKILPLQLGEGKKGVSMYKQVINDDKAKVNVVVLKNESLDIIAKGIARCHEEDTYNKELGENLANTKAWLQYYNKLSKNTDKELAYAYEIVEYWQKEISRLVSVKHTADAKARVIKEELDNIMKDL